jgi:hypothetical protein
MTEHLNIARLLVVSAEFFEQRGFCRVGDVGAAVGLAAG